MAGYSVVTYLSWYSVSWVCYCPPLTQVFPLDSSNTQCTLLFYRFYYLATYVHAFPDLFNSSMSGTSHDCSSIRLWVQKLVYLCILCSRSNVTQAELFLHGLRLAWAEVRRMATCSETVVAALSRQEGWTLHVDTAITRTPLTVLMSVGGLDKIHCAFCCERPRKQTRPVYAYSDKKNELFGGTTISIQIFYI
jgi:hypothetical protein